MQPADYAQFTDELVDRLRADDRVIGLVALGSMAGTERAPDRWSDHDFWIVTLEGTAETLRAGTDWLPRTDRIVLTFTETAHGRSAIYDDGHLVEYAVFDDHELEVARANAFRVLLDRADIEARMRAIAERTTAEQVGDDPTGADRFGALLAQLTIGVNRYGRGELLSANDLIRGRAARTLVSLLGSFAPSARGHPDSLDPHRRFEERHPSLAREIDDALHEPTLTCAESMLSITRRELSGQVPGATRAAFDAVQGTVDRARSTPRPG